MTGPAGRSGQCRAQMPDAIVRLVAFAAAAILLLNLSGLARPFQVANAGLLFVVADDSMITFRVAHNIAMGLGAYFNPGEHVAANTSLSLPFLLSPVFHLFNLSYAVYVLAMLSMVISATTLFAVACFAETVPAAVLTLGSLALLPTNREYASTMWEHVPQCLMVTLALCAVLGRWPCLRRRNYEAGLIFLAVAFWLRPDCLPLMLPLICVIAWRLRSRLDVTSAAALLATVAAIAGYFLLHFHLYGAFLPNTYYLKVSFGLRSLLDGTIYVGKTIVDSSTPLALIILFLFFIRARSGWSTAETVVLSGMLLQVLYIVAVGGDVFFYGRFFLLISPVVWMLFWEKILGFLKESSGYAQPMVKGAAGIVVFCFLLAQIKMYAAEQETSTVPFYQSSFVALAPDAQMAQASLAGYIRTHFRPQDGEVGLFYLGSLGYYLPDFKIADFLGKADAVIAHEPVKWGPVGHNKWDIRHSLEDRNVAVIPFNPIPQSVAESILSRKLDFAFFPALQLDPYLQSHYTYFSPQRLGLVGPEGLYVRNDLIGRIPPADSDSR